MLKGLNILLGSKIFQKVNILHFQLAAGRGKKLYFLFSCDNISPLKAGMKRLIEFKATEIIYPILQALGQPCIKVNRFFKASFSNQRGPFYLLLLLPFIIVITVIYLPNSLKVYSINKHFMNFYRRSKFFCLSELRTDYFRERKGLLKHFLC